MTRFALSLLCACAPMTYPRGEAIVIDLPAELLAIPAAVSAARAGTHAWDESGAGFRLPDEAPAGAVIHIAVTCIPAEPSTVNGQTGMTLGEYQNDGSLQVWCDGMQQPRSDYAAWWGDLFAHELGHALGLHHVTEPGNIMTPTDSDLVVPGPDDLAMLDAL